MVNQMKGRYKVASPGLKPLWEEAKRRAAKLERFEISHTLRGGNKEADRLANQAMDNRWKAAGQPVSEPASQKVSGSTNQPAVGVSDVSPVRANAYERPPKPPQQTFEGIVKNGVIHLIEGELPEGAMVKVTRQ